MPLGKFKIYCVALFFVAGYFSFFGFVYASTIDELNKSIEDRKSRIKQVQEEIEKYQKEIENTGKETTSLKSKIKNLEATGKKLAADIKLTQNQIQSAKFNIEKLNLQIGLKAEGIVEKKDSLGEFVRAINEAESASVLEVIISEDVFSDFFSNIDRMDTFQKEINSNLADLKEDKIDLAISGDDELCDMLKKHEKYIQDKTNAVDIAYKEKKAENRFEDIIKGRKISIMFDVLS